MSYEMNRRKFVATLTKGSVAVLGAGFLPGCTAENSLLVKKPTGKKPNFIFILTDDQGYADVGVYGAKGFQTPNIDAMAAEGMMFTDFYVQPVCSPTRASFMTGCYPQRVGIENALSPTKSIYSRIGINSDELTISESLKQNGYATGCFGKWHLGHEKKFLPMRYGFDEYFGLPYSNDMTTQIPENVHYGFPDKLPIIEGDEIIGYDPDQDMLTTRYTERAVDFIKKNKDKPFFVYLPHSMPHFPIHVSDTFRGKSENGLYGDVMMELDWSVGQILKTLKENGLDENTIVMFASDNGPWLRYGNHGGSALPLREGKVTTFEGGMRVPFVVRWPGKVPAGKVCNELTTIMDVFPTVARLTGSKMPDKKIDGKNIWPLLAGVEGVKSPHEAYFYYYRWELQAVRYGKWKLHFPHSFYKAPVPGMDGEPGKIRFANVRLALYDLQNDIEEKVDVADKYPDVVEKLAKLADNMREDLGDGRVAKTGKGRREPGKL